MINTIIKRDGRTVVFDVSKIATAIYKAALAVGGTDEDTAKSIANTVASMYEHDNPEKTPTVEEIQDLVEKVLIKKGHAKTAKAYILYRDKRTRARELNTSLMKTFEELTFTRAEDSDIKRENANINGDTAMGTMLKYGSTASKEFYEMNVLAPRHSEAHRNGDIHIHDLDFYTLTTTCTQIDLTKLFTHGFSTGHGYLREPNDISSYAALACIAIQSNQNDQHGGQSIPKFDYDLANGVKKTFKHKYYDNIKRGLMYQGHSEDQANDIIKTIKDGIDCEPCLDDSNGYLQKEKNLVHDKEIMHDEDFIKLQNTSYQLATEETDRATYQAMEALIHNLNTMNSRAGAQVEI